jgi:hypothetical protein
MCARGSGSAIGQDQVAAHNCRERGRDGEAMTPGSRVKPTHVMARRTTATPQREAGRAAAVAVAQQRGGAAVRRPAWPGRGHPQPANTRQRACARCGHM